MSLQKSLITVAFLCLQIASASTQAQVNGSGPSDPSLFGSVIDVTDDQSDLPNIGGSLSETVQLNISGEGEIGNFFRAGLGSEVNISEGGRTGIGFRSIGGEVNINGGTIGSGSELFGAELNLTSGTIETFGNSGSLETDAARINGSLVDSTVNVSGGVIEGRFYASNTLVNISGGRVNDLDASFDSVVNVSSGNAGITASAGSDVNVAGGSISRLSALERSNVEISGGRLGTVRILAGSDVRLDGAEFQLNGNSVSGDTLSVGDDDIFTGTLQDGSAFVIAGVDGEDISSIRLNQVAIPELDLNPITVNNAGQNAPAGLRAGQTLSLVDGGDLGENFETVGATINIAGGIVGEGATFFDSDVTISGGSFGEDLAIINSQFEITDGALGFRSFIDNSVGTISGGSIPSVSSSGSRFEINNDSQVTITGGEIGDLSLVNDSVVDISGGIIGERFSVFGESTANISGGTFGNFFTAAGTANVNITDGEFGSFNASSDSIVSISGGRFVSLSAVNRSTVDISGGTFERIFLQGPAELNLSGGTVSGLVTSNSGDLNIFGTEFFIDGDLVEFLALGETLNLRGQDLTLAGTLLDGSDFEIQFGSGVSSQSFVNSVNLTLSTAVPEPSSLMLLIACFGLGTLKRRRPPVTR